MLRMKLTGLLVLLFILSSCIKNNERPSWLKIEKWSLQANGVLNGSEGQLTQNFTDAWVYIDDNLIGVFELPVKIPVLQEGAKKISIYPAIRRNGISATKGIYPFCQPHIINPTLVRGEVLNIQPATSYYSTCKFWIEDFEQAGIKFETDPTSNAALERLLHSESDLYGQYYGHVSLTSSDSLWTGYTSGEMILPKGGAEVYLEVDYKNTNQILTGVIGFLNTGNIKDNPNIRMNQQPVGAVVWKKIYIDIKEIVSNSLTANYFKQYIQVLLDAGETSGEVYIDNIKVIHF